MFSSDFGEMCHLLAKALLLPKQVKIEPALFSSAFCTHVTVIKRLWLEINEIDLFKGLGICKLKTLPDNTQNVLKEKEKFEGFYSEKYTFEKSQSVILSPQIGSRWKSSRCRCLVVWIMKPSL